MLTYDFQRHFRIIFRTLRDFYIRVTSSNDTETENTYVSHDSSDSSDTISGNTIKSYPNCPCGIVKDE